MTGAEPGSGKVALITGATTALGRSLSAALHDAGYALALENGATEPSGDDARGAIKQASRDIIRRGGRAVWGDHDLTTADGAGAAVTLATDTFGRLDLLVACAALGRTRSLHRIEESVWAGLVAHTLTSTFLCCQAAARAMTSGEQGGRLVCVTGSASSRASDFGRVHAAAVTGGIVGQVRAMASELRPRGITVNAVAPAVVAPPAEQTPTDHADLPTRYQTENVAPLVLFLVSDAAAEVTGQVVAVNEERLSILRSVESAGAVAADEPWTVEAIARRWGELSR